MTKIFIFLFALFFIFSCEGIETGSDSEKPNSDSSSSSSENSGENSDENPDPVSSSPSSNSGEENQCKIQQNQEIITCQITQTNVSVTNEFSGTIYLEECQPIQLEDTDFNPSVTLGFPLDGPDPAVVYISGSLSDKETLAIRIDLENDDSFCNVTSATATLSRSGDTTKNEALNGNISILSYETDASFLPATIRMKMDFKLTFSIGTIEGRLSLEGQLGG